MKVLILLVLLIPCLSFSQNATDVPTQLPKKKPIKAATKQAQVLPDATPTSTKANESKVTESGPAAKKTGSHVPIDSSQALRLNYGYPKWNKSPTQIDTGSILMREGQGGRLVQIHLEETAPDSSLFSGLFSVNWTNLEAVQPEFYIPPQELLTTTKGLKQLNEMIARNELKRHPFILRKTRTGQVLEIYDTGEQAKIAIQAFRDEQQAIEFQNKKLVSQQDADVANLAADAKQREIEARALAERTRLEQIEAQKAADRLRHDESLSKAQREANKKKAVDSAAQALGFYQKGQYLEARAKFEEAIDLDPENRAYLYQYGVTLYKLEDFTHAVVVLKAAEGPSVNQNEKQYYLGLSYYRLKQNETAFAAFQKVIDAKDPQLAGSALFYQGLMRMDEKKYNEARGIFQKILDTSSDATLDQRAENNIEQIIRLQQFENEKAKKWTFNGTLGEMYDSNVTLASTSSQDQGTATNVDGYRTLLQGSAKYRPVYETDKEFAAQLDILDMYSVDNRLAFSQTLRNSDPFVATLTLPYTHKGLLLGKGHKFDIIPGYESTWMSVENNTNKEILNSYLLNILNTVVMNDSWFANFNLESRKDNSELSSSTGLNDSSAIKIKFTWGNLLMLNKEKGQIALINSAYTLNQAQGANTTFNRFDLSGTYVTPCPAGISCNATLSYFMLAYPQNSSGRIDNSYTLAAGGSHKVAENLTGGFTANYNINNSNVDANQYKKWTAMLTLSYSH